MIDRTRSVGTDQTVDPRFARRNRTEIPHDGSPTANGREHRNLDQLSEMPPVGPWRDAMARSRVDERDVLGRNAQGTVRNCEPPTHTSPGRTPTEKARP